MATQYHNPGLPSTLYSGGNVRIDTRPLANMLFQDQKIREAQRQKEAAALDEDMKSNVAKIRDADVPDFVSGYQDYRTAKMGLNNAALKRDPQAFAQAQMEVARKYGNVMKLANESKQARDLYEHVDKDRFTRPDNYVDDYFDKRAVINKTPLSKLRQVQTGVDPTTGQPIYIDYSSPDSLLYKGQYDPTKLLETARGEKLTNEVDEGATDKTGLQNKVTTYQFYGNKPSQYKNTILNAMAGDRAANRFFTTQLKNTSPEEIVKVNEQFKAIPADVWKKMGVNKEDLQIEHPENQADVAATYLAQKHALENMPRAIKSDLRTNEAVKMKMQKQNELEKEQRAHAYRIQEEQFKADLKGKSAGDQANAIDERLSGIEQAAVNANKGFTVYGVDKAGDNRLVYEVTPSTGLLKSFAKKDERGKEIYPNKIGFKDGIYYPIFYKTDDNYNPIRKGNGYEIDGGLSRPQRRADVKADYSNEMLTPKLVEQNLEEGEVGVPPTNPPKLVKPIKPSKGGADNL